MTAGFVARDGESQRLAWIGGSVHHVLLDAAATEGRLTALRTTQRGGAASPVHVHEREDETLFLLAGTAQVWVGDRRWTVRAGDTAFLPRGVPHTYLFTSDTAEVLTICNPSGMEDFLRAAGWDLSRPEPDGWKVDLDTLAAAAAATGQRILGPPLGAGDAMPAPYLGETDT